MNSKMVFSQNFQKKRGKRRELLMTTETNLENSSTYGIDQVLSVLPLVLGDDGKIGDDWLQKSP